MRRRRHQAVLGIEINENIQRVAFTRALRHILPWQQDVAVLSAAEIEPVSG